MHFVYMDIFATNSIYIDIVSSALLIDPCIGLNRLKLYMKCIQTQSHTPNTQGLARITSWSRSSVALTSSNKPNRTYLMLLIVDEARLAGYNKLYVHYVI